MTRTEFHKLFKSTGPVVLPVIHVLDAPQTVANVRVAISEGAAGVFLINHDFGNAELLPVIHNLRTTFPSLWIGVSFMRTSGRIAFPILAGLARDGTGVDAYWGDDAGIDERVSPDAQAVAVQIGEARQRSGWQGLYFGGTAFKGQRAVDPEHHETAARIASAHMDVVCTSGAGTGKEPDLQKIAAFRRGAGDCAVAVASGITPENAAAFARDIDCFMVATGINREGDFYNIDPGRLRQLLAATRAIGAGI